MFHAGFLLCSFFDPEDVGNVFPKRRLILNGLHYIIPQNVELFATTAVRTSNPTCKEHENRSFYIILGYSYISLFFFSICVFCIFPGISPIQIRFELIHLIINCNTSNVTIHKITSIIPKQLNSHVAWT
jgi:hypothetical protein